MTISLKVGQTDCWRSLKDTTQHYTAAISRMNYRSDIYFVDDETKLEPVSTGIINYSGFNSGLFDSNGSN
ncbi:MAG: hypothetical protein AAFR77_03310 [Cyanobacteria bacterium J06631_2]